LGQKEGNKEYVIYYISKNLQGAELNYTLIEKEMLAVVYAINKFRHYITGYPVFIHVDHTTIRYLMNIPMVGGRLVRWLLLLQEFDITIVDKPRKANMVADCLSRFPTQLEEGVVDDYFLDEHFFSHSVHTPWFVDIANYLVLGQIPSHFSPRKKNSWCIKAFHTLGLLVIYSTPI